MLLGRAYRKAQRRQPDFDKETQRHLTALAALEKENARLWTVRRIRLRRCWPAPPNTSQTR